MAAGARAGGRRPPAPVDFRVPDPTRVYLCRHAEPDNPSGVFYGHLPGFGLGELGRRQARGMSEFLAGAGITRAYTSPLLRARETAAIICGGLPTRPQPEVREDLLETAFGRYIQGIRRPEVVYRRPLFFLHLLFPGLLPGDETVAAMAARVGRVVEDAAAAVPGGAALLVSHADPIKAYWNTFLGRSERRFHLLKVAKGSCLELAMADGRLTKVTYHPPRFQSGLEGSR
jgi:broad specificity phosphatase PhoE